MTVTDDSFPYPRLLPPDPVAPVPDEVARAVERHRSGDPDGARSALRAMADAGRTATAGHAAAALAGIELAEGGPDEPFWGALEQVAAGEDPWLGPLAAALPSMELYSVLESMNPGASPADHPVIRGLAAHLTGDQDGAEEAFEQAAAEAAPGRLEDDLAHVLLGHQLLHRGANREAEEALTRVLAEEDQVFCGYARFLLGHVLVERGELDEAGTVLTQAMSETHPSEHRVEEGLHSWVGVRLGELLAGTYELDCVVEEMENGGMSELYCTRQPFESGAFFTKVSRPALAQIGLHLFPGDLDTVRSELRRLREWSDERYERGRKLCLLLGERLLVDERDEREQALQLLLGELKEGGKG
ncbi:tetratricopeptide repeat protein [Streptomyces boluensis]|uniref:Tetratricopeptide repeat protein n=1 Tax=Streptomyces boluensis TaxID=1775135 RepID=A0A964UVX5_9ACTN|nr:hypothetical protein [Streptomyces boluensis]NBE56418.1 hypothetical protein [Streptomyces boluensis]